MLREENKSVMQQWERRVDETEERYKRLAYHSFDAVFVQRAGRIENANPAGATLLGADSTHALIGRTEIKYVRQEYEALAHERELLKQEYPTRPQEMKIGRLNGDIRDVQVSVAPIAFDGEPSV